MRNRGQKQYEKWKHGERLTWKDIVLAKCFECAGNQARKCTAICPAQAKVSEPSKTRDSCKDKRVKNRFKKAE